jgi:curved DNA-binding protein CbpA
MAAKLNPKFLAQVSSIAGALDQLDYFQLLRLPQDAGEEQIRAAYRQQARQLHPDQYAHFGDAQLTHDLTRIAKRLTEAYVVLRQQETRRRYLEGLSGPERSAHLRFRAEETSEHEVSASTHQGRQFLTEALAARERGQLQEGLRSLKMALLYEQDNEPLRDLAQIWEKELRDEPAE